MRVDDEMEEPASDSMHPLVEKLGLVQKKWMEYRHAVQEMPVFKRAFMPVFDSLEIVLGQNWLDVFKQRLNTEKIPSTEEFPKRTPIKRDIEVASFLSELMAFRDANPTSR